MKILSLDTSMAACSVAVIDTGSVPPLAEAFRAMERGHAEALAPMVAEVMQASGLEFRDLDRIAVTIGPGTFTGVRIGLSFARGAGLACGVPVIGIDSLSAISANARSGLPLLVVAGARLRASHPQRRRRDHAVHLR
jgi:tRNA threonylcarbamoyladenosine biosynthesis protein TsaB